MPVIRFHAAALISLSLVPISLTAGCTNQPYTSAEQQAQNACQAFGPKTLSGAAIGALGGAAGGALIGGAAGNGRGAAIGAGVGAIAGLIGGLVVGHNLDARDCAEAQQALAQVRYTPTMQPVSWTSPSGSHGSLTPITDEYAGDGGQLCRQVRQDTTLTGHDQTSAVVLTCRQPDGDYKTVQPAAS